MDNFDSSDNFDVATRDSSSMDNNNSSSNSDFDGLPNNYLCDSFPNKMLMEALKELNISDIKDFLNNDISKPFRKQKCAPPPQ